MYVLFETHEQAANAIKQLNENKTTVAAELGIQGADGNLAPMEASWSESERLLRGPSGTYKQNLILKFIGKGGDTIRNLKAQSGARFVVLNGKNHNGEFIGNRFGAQQHEADFRLHLGITGNLRS